MNKIYEKQKDKDMENEGEIVNIVLTIIWRKDVTHLSEA